MFFAMSTKIISVTVFSRLIGKEIKGNAGNDLGKEETAMDHLPGEGKRLFDVN